jgi:hypothetical protein
MEFGKDHLRDRSTGQDPRLTCHDLHNRLFRFSNQRPTGEVANVVKIFGQCKVD